MPPCHASYGCGSCDYRIGIVDFAVGILKIALAVMRRSNVYSVVRLLRCGCTGH